MELAASGRTRMGGSHLDRRPSNLVVREDALEILRCHQLDHAQVIDAKRVAELELPEEVAARFGPRMTARSIPR